MASGPRIYNLFPSLVGPVPAWEHHLEAVRGMHFNWVFLNPFHVPGASGSLYAVKDYYRLNPLFQGDDEQDADRLLRGFLEAAQSAGLAVMMDLVINHTAKDSPLVEEHPEWFVHDEDGSVRSPSAVHPDDPGDVTTWDDLAEIDYRHPRDRQGLLQYWQDMAAHYAGLGFRGFRCDAAYQIPGDIWGEIIAAVRDVNPETYFFGETLGAQPEEIEQLHGAGFDYFFNSAKWWDFREDWLLDQYERFRHIAPSIAFPESHDTPRLAAETHGDERRSRFWYLFTAFFSTGVMMPIGYEHGLRKALHVVETRPEPAQEPGFDLTAFVSESNRMKSETAVLNEEGPQGRFTDPEDPLVGLVRRSEQGARPAAALMNPGEEVQEFPSAQLAEVIGADPGAVEEITPRAEQTRLADRESVVMQPWDIRVFVSADT